MIEIHSQNRIVSERENLGADVNNKHQSCGRAERDKKITVVKKEIVFLLTHY